MNIKIPKTRREIRELAKRKMKLPKFARETPWLWWHYHHSGLCELHESGAIRLRDIMRWKEAYERPVRVAFLNPVKKMPPVVDKLFKDYTKKLKAWKLDGNSQTHHRMVQARTKLSTWLYNHKTEVRRWHARECGKNCPYDKNMNQLYFFAKEK